MQFWPVVMACWAAAWPVAVAWQRPGVGWFPAFLCIREWVWLGIALSLAAFCLWRWWRPRPDTAPAAYRMLLVWCALAIATAAVGPVVSATGRQWLSARAVYRTLAAVCCLTWAQMGPRLRVTCSGESPGAARCRDLAP
jgi:hypothetical protein